MFEEDLSMGSFNWVEFLAYMTMGSIAVALPFILAGVALALAGYFLMSCLLWVGQAFDRWPTAAPIVLISGGIGLLAYLGHVGVIQ